MRQAILAAALATLPVYASGQVNTTCQKIGNITYCNTNQPTQNTLPPPSSGTSVIDGARYVQEGLDRGRADREARDRTKRDAELHAAQMEVLRLQAQSLSAQAPDKDAEIAQLRSRVASLERDLNEAIVNCAAK